MATRVLRPLRQAPVGAAAAYRVEHAVAVTASLGLATLIVLAGLPQLLRVIGERGSWARQPRLGPFSDRQPE